MKKGRFTALILSFLISVSCVFMSSGAAAAESYEEYLNLQTNSDSGENGNYEYTSENGEILEGGKALNFKINLEKDGVYNLGMLFNPESTHDKYTLGLKIDGEYPFNEVKELEIYSVFGSSEITVDEYGNETAPISQPDSGTHKTVFKDISGQNNNAYLFKLTGGEHTVSLSLDVGKIRVKSLIVNSPEKVPSYAEYAELYKNEGSAVNQKILIEAETPDLKSDRTLIAGTDRSNLDTTSGGNKNSPEKIRLNMLKGDNFHYPGQWVAYNFDVKESGLYKISLRVRQNISEGMFSSRKILIDGALPFKELEAVSFDYSDSWYTVTPGGEKPYLVYLEKGKHQIKLEVTTGSLSELRSELNTVLGGLNGLYRKIFMVTGSSPDRYMDYDLASQIPGLADDIKEYLTLMQSSLNKLTSLANGRKGTGFSVMDSLIAQLKAFGDNPDRIEDSISSFKDNLSALGSWIASLSEQPLDIDSIEICSPDLKSYDYTSGFFAVLKFHMRSLFASFVNDYDTAGGNGASDISVWVMNGREQAQVVKNLVSNSFTPETGISVEVSVVTTGLVEATLAGTGPDAALYVPETTPVFLGARGVLANLNNIDGFADIRARFTDELFTPYTYNGAVYGIPLSFDFPVLFYRTDVFSELGLEVPEDWNAFYKAISVIQNKMMDVGIPSTLFETLLFQNGGDYFNTALDKCVLDSEEGVSAFRQLTDFFTVNSLPISYNFYNRFRTGEMPLAVENYSLAAQLNYAAPEIKGLWSMAPLPKNENSNSKYLKGTTLSAVLFEKSKDNSAASKFLNWFTLEEIQAQYGNQTESVLGVAGRYTPANAEVLSFFGWDSSELALLKSQFEVVKEVPVIPSSYYISRSFNNAFRKVVYSGENPRETLLLYVRDINKEITRKQKEFER